MGSQRTVKWTGIDFLKIWKAQFGGIEATLQQSKSLFDKARSKHFHAHGEGCSWWRFRLWFRFNEKYMYNPIFDYVSSSSSEDEEEPEPVPEPVIEPEPEPEPVPEPVPDVTKGAVF